MNMINKYYPSVDEFINPCDKIDYENIRKQILAMQKFTFGVEINVLIMTDRLLGSAKGLQEYMQNSSDITADFVSCFSEAKMIIDHKHIDFFIIIGYQSNKINFNSVDLIRKYNKYSTVIMYAHLDAFTTDNCRKYEISEIYDRTKPIEGLIEYMRKCYSQKNINFLKENPANTTREQLRLNAIHDEYTAVQLQELKLLSKKKKEHRTKILINICAIVSALFILVILLIGLSNSQ